MALDIRYETLILPQLHHFFCSIPSKIEWDLTNGPLSKLQGLLDSQV